VSADKSVAKELVETLKDGERGFASAADKLRDSNRPEWATTLQKFSEQRADFSREIIDMGHEYTRTSMRAAPSPLPCTVDGSRSRTR
jgi:hypothetical protein